MSKKSLSFLKVSFPIKLIAYIVVPWGWINSFAYRFHKGNILGGILAFVFPVFWLIDLITIILSNKITVLA